MSPEETTKEKKPEKLEKSAAGFSLPSIRTNLRPEESNYRTKDPWDLTRDGFRGRRRGFLAADAGWVGWWRWGSEKREEGRGRIRNGTDEVA